MRMERYTELAEQISGGFLGSADLMV
jgi:hypothetical protein